MPEQRYTDKDLIRILRRAEKVLGRPPAIRDLDYQRVPGVRMPGSFTYKARFGKWSEALRLAFGEHVAYAQSTGLADEAKLEADMKALAEKLGRTPVATEMSAEPGTYHANTYIRHYGSWNRAVGYILIPF